MKPTVDTLSELYSDPRTCADMVGLDYVDDSQRGLTRIRHGKGFKYQDIETGKAVGAEDKKRIVALVIPPAWQDVWISASPHGHVLATGIDEKARKQYMYHPKWRTMRDLIKFYRMLIFGRALPKIRKDIDAHLNERKLTEQKVIAIMLWILDNSYIRIGNDTYFKANESVGLTTLTDRNIVIAGPVVTLAFTGKSGKEQQITFENAAIAKVLDELRQVKGARLFRYTDGAGDWHAVDSDDINKYLHELTGAKISAKDFRTWGGTLMAFLHLLEEDNNETDRKPEKVVIEAIDQAAAVLGNTRTVARASYVHPHILGAYGSKDFKRFYTKATKGRKITGLDRHESDLFYFLEQLFAEQFEIIKQKPA